MTTYSKGLENSKTNIEGFMKDMSRYFTAGVPTNFSASSLQVVQRGAGANMSVDVSIGDAHLIRPTSDYSFYVWQDAVTNVVITTAPVSNSRIDAIVAWVDTSVTNVSLNNSPGSLKFSAIAGTVAGSPTAPVDSAIQTALGSTVAWTRLANVTVGTSVTSIVNANIADQRAPIKVRANVPTVAIEDNAVTTAKINNGAVTAPKISDNTWNQTVQAISYNAVIAGTWTRFGSSGTGAISTSAAQSSGAQNDEVQYKVFLTAGTYTILIHHDKDVNRGIYTILGNAVSLGTTDAYAGTRLAGTVSQVTNSYVVATSGVIDVRVRMATKNGSASAYYANFYDIQFIRTA